jgi:hypothetical protein
MRQIVIKQGVIGLVFKNAELIKVLQAGKHWIGWGKEVRMYSLFNQYVPHVELDLLLKNGVIRKMLNVIEVGDHELTLRFEKGRLQEVLKPGTHAFWNLEVKHTFQTVDLTRTEEITELRVNLLKKLHLMPYVRAFVVEPFEKGLLFVDGELKKELGPGTYHFWKNATPISLSKVDMRLQQLEVSGQEMLTKDKAALRINFFAEYKVKNVKEAIGSNVNFVKQLYVQLQIALREYVGAFTLDELLEKKDEIGPFILEHFQSKAELLGVVLLDAGIRDVILPGEMKTIMNQVLIAQKQAQANSITRREETASTRSLLNTAKLMENNEMLFTLKEMEYMEKIADRIGEITINGNGNAVAQLKEIFTPQKK